MTDTVNPTATLAAEPEPLHAVHTTTGAPDPEWIRGTCPSCGAPVVSNAYHVGGKGYVLLWECWTYLTDKPLPPERRRCDWRRVL